MKSIFSSILNKFTKNSFKIFCIVGCFLGDLLFIVFMKTIVLIPENFNSFLDDYAWMENIGNIRNLPDTSKLEYLKLLILSLNFFIITYLLVAVIFYLLFYKEKKLGIDFVKYGTALFGIILSIVTSYEAYSYSIFWSLILLSLAPVYLLIFVGTRKFF